MQGCSPPMMLWVPRHHCMKPGLILFTTQMRFQAYLPKSTAFSALLPVLLWLTWSTWPRLYFWGRMVDSLEFAYANEFTNWCKSEKKGRPHSGGLGQCSRTSRGSAEQTLGVLPILMFTARKSDVNTSSQEFYSELSLCCQEILLGTGLKFPPSVAMYCLMPKTAMETDSSGWSGIWSGIRFKLAEGMLLIVGDWLCAIECIVEREPLIVIGLKNTNWKATKQNAQKHSNSNFSKRIKAEK